MYLPLCSLREKGQTVTVWIVGLVNDKSQEEDLWDDTKLQLNSKQPNLGWINPRFFQCTLSQMFTIHHSKESFLKMPPIHNSP